jgi:hypothetical protein
VSVTASPGEATTAGADAPAATAAAAAQRTPAAARNSHVERARPTAGAASSSAASPKSRKAQHPSGNTRTDPAAKQQQQQQERTGRGLRVSVSGARRAGAASTNGAPLTGRRAFQRSTSVAQSVISSKALPPHWQGAAEQVLDQYAIEARAALGRGEAAAAAAAAAARCGAAAAGGQIDGAGGGSSMQQRRRQQQQQRRRLGGGPPQLSIAGGDGRAGTAGSLTSGQRRTGSAGGASGGSPRARRDSETGSVGDGLEDEEDALLGHVLMVRGQSTTYTTAFGAVTLQPPSHFNSCHSKPRLPSNKHQQRSSSPEPPALRTAPQMFPLRHVAKAFGHDLPAEAEAVAAANLAQQRHGLMLTVLGPVPAPPSAAAAAGEWNAQRQKEASSLAAAPARSASAPPGEKRRQTAGAAGRGGGGAAPPLPLPAVTEAVQLQLRSLTASPVVAAHYSKAELLLASAFETLQPHRVAPASAPARRRGGAKGARAPPLSAGAARKGAPVGTTAGAGGEAAGGGGQPAVSIAAGAGEQQPAATAAATDKAGADSSNGTAVVATDGATAPTNRTMRTDGRAGPPADALQQLLAAHGGRTSPVRSRLLQSADERRRKSASRAASAGGSCWGRASLDGGTAAVGFSSPTGATTAAAASSNGSQQQPAVESKARRRCASASPGLYPPGHSCVMNPTQLLALAPAQLPSQAPGWSLVGRKCGVPPPRQHHHQQQRTPEHHPHDHPLQQQPQSKFRFDFERHLAIGGPLASKIPPPADIDESISRQPPPPSELPPNYAFGDVGRFLRRYTQQGGGGEFDLSHGLRGPAQVPALAQAMGCMGDLRALSLRNTGLDNWSLQVGLAKICVLGLSAGLVYGEV